MTPAETATDLARRAGLPEAQRVAMTMLGEATPARVAHWKAVVDELQRRADRA